MSNTTMMAQARRSGGGLWRRVCLRASGMLMIACAAAIVFPGLAKAQSTGCRATSSTVIDLIPSVNFVIENMPPPGIEIYRTKTYVINYDCTLYDRFGRPDTGTPQLQALGDYRSLNNALNRAGLRLYIVVNGNESSPWTPNLDPAGGPISEVFPLGASYTESTGPRVVTLVAKLVVINQFPSPARYPVPASTMFKISAAYGRGAAPGPFIVSTATRMQFTPKCIGDVSVDNLVRFNNVYATAGYLGSLPQQVPFNVTSRINPLCSIGSLTRPLTPDNAWTQFSMLLSAQFVLQGVGRIDADGKSIILTNEDGEENGLKMQILDASNANQPVVIHGSAVPPSRDDVGNFGELVGDKPAAAVHTYLASLTSDGGKELKLGKYSTQVLVKVSYY
ncbi:Uncharacterised protein [Achromobacter xylosoxidans]|nr:Uncharacterised protein [Achromobacter xylosoxidans]